MPREGVTGEDARVLERAGMGMQTREGCNRDAVRGSSRDRDSQRFGK
jgi:hypothetical protein